MKKILSVCLALLMLLSCFAVPTTAFAAVPKKPTVSSVSAGAAAFTVKWKKVSGVTGYHFLCNLLERADWAAMGKKLEA